MLLTPRHPHRDRLAAAIAPELVVVEVASALLKYVRAGLVTRDDARGILDDLLRSPLELRSLRPLVVAVLEAAGRLGVSAYDAAYLVFAESEDLPLITADRRLASVAKDAVLVE